MEIVCAGYPKTGTKSCSAALRKLGYKVADYVDTGEHLSYVWTDYIREKTTIENVIVKGTQNNNLFTSGLFPVTFLDILVYSRISKPWISR